MNFRLINPFPGIRPFKESEKQFFFGRESQTNRMLDKLESSRFLAIVGVSGSGKSSLVNCGLLPALLADVEKDVKIIRLKPGQDPLDELSNALCSCHDLIGVEISEQSKKEFITNQLNTDSHGIVDIYQYLKIKGGKLLIYVDQFEELFRYTPFDKDDQKYNSLNVEKSRRFVDLLLTAVGQQDYPIYVTITMRSDFLGDCTRYRNLPEAINNGQYLIPRLTREERKRAITGPVNYYHDKGVTIEPALVSRLLNDMGDDPDQLSIIQHALQQTWNGAADKAGENATQMPITLGDYIDAGTISKALNKDADKAFDSYGANKAQMQQWCSRIFKCITAGKGAREPQKVKELLYQTGICKRSPALPESNNAAGPEHDYIKQGITTLETALLPFRDRSFITPSTGDSPQLDENTQIDISHESLMRNWAKLKDWVQEEKDAGKYFRWVATLAYGNLYNGGSLLSGNELANAVDWRENKFHNQDWAIRYAGKDKASYIETINYIEKSKKRRGIKVVGIFTFVLVMLVLALQAYYEHHKNEVNTLQVNLSSLQAKNAALERDSLGKKNAQILQEKLTEDSAIAEIKIKDTALNISYQTLQIKQNELNDALGREGKINIKLKKTNEYLNDTSKLLRASEDSLKKQNNRQRELTQKYNILAHKNMGLGLAAQSLIEQDNKLKADFALAAAKIFSANGGGRNDSRIYHALHSSLIADSRGYQVKAKDKYNILDVYAGAEGVYYVNSNGEMHLVKDGTNPQIRQLMEPVEGGFIFAKFIAANKLLLEDFSKQTWLLTFNGAFKDGGFTKAYVSMKGNLRKAIYASGTPLFMLTSAGQLYQLEITEKNAGSAALTPQLVPGRIIRDIVMAPNGMPYAVSDSALYWIKKDSGGNADSLNINGKVFGKPRAITAGDSALYIGTASGWLFSMNFGAGGRPLPCDTFFTHQGEISAMEISDSGLLALAIDGGKICLKWPSAQNYELISEAVKNTRLNLWKGPKGSVFSLENRIANEPAVLKIWYFSFQKLEKILCETKENSQIQVEKLYDFMKSREFDDDINKICK